MMQANSVALVARGVPAGAMRTALGIQAAAQALGLALGPTVGGLLVAHASWRWAFWINVPIAVLGLLAELVPAAAQPPRARPGPPCRLGPTCPGPPRRAGRARWRHPPRVALRPARPRPVGGRLLLAAARPLDRRRPAAAGLGRGGAARRRGRLHGRARPPGAAGGHPDHRPRPGQHPRRPG
ncbi:MFS transporter [Kitasatospora arboriphila]